MRQPVASRTRREQLQSVVGSIAQEMNSVLPTGDVAELRRLDPRDPASPAYWKVLVRRVEPEMSIVGSPDKQLLLERRWTTILSAMAELQGLHSPRVPLGRAMAEAGVSEMRLSKLLRARSDALHDLVRTVSHQLASRAAPADQVDIAQLVLSEGESDEESTRRRIAREYFRRIA